MKPNMNNKIYLSPPHMNGEENSYIEDAINSNWVAPLGPHVDAFENELANYHYKLIHKLALDYSF